MSDISDDALGEEEQLIGEPSSVPYGPPGHAEVDEEEDVESVLTEYDAEDFISGAVVSSESTIPEDLFCFEHSYSYDCRKYFNVCSCDETVVAWAAGSLLSFLDVSTSQTWFRRSTTGGTVCHIASYRKDPNYRIAIAEAAEAERAPIILIYFWPQMDIDAVLRDGTTNAYSILDFSPDGELLASVGREPDYNITIWQWKRHNILLRTSAFTFDVNTVIFSPYVPGQLTTAGAAHIKFWKMSNTFTGLKLEGDLGRFGKTEICDVLGVYPMPDEKVLSGCEWGNILVWEAGLVKVEVTQRGRKRCHDAPIVQFMLSDARDEVTTVARDGCVRAWYWDTVEQADPPEDDQYVELNPVAETCAPGAAIMCIRHQKDQLWYAQDGNGGVWTVDLEVDKLECSHRKVFTSHAGAVTALAALRAQPLFVSLGADGALHVYHAERRALLLRQRYPVPVRSLLYPPVEVDSTSLVLVIGFEDGVMRTVIVEAEALLQKPPGLVEIVVDPTLESDVHIEAIDNPAYIKLISLLKPHSAAVTQISLNIQNTLLVTASEDSTLFLYRVNLKEKPFELQRLGFINTPSIICYMTWKPEEERTLLLCAQEGLLLEVILPKAAVRPYNEITSFQLEFESKKESFMKEYLIQYRPFPEEDDLASLDEEALKKAAEDSSDDEDDDEWRGEVELVTAEGGGGACITFAEYTEDGSVWCVQKGLGALLLYRPGAKDVDKFGPLPGAWRDSITIVQFICDKRYIIVGTENGYIRVMRVLTHEEDNSDVYVMRQMLAAQRLAKKLKGRRLAKPEPDPIPRLDFIDNYYLPMHDRYTGAITSLVFTSDGKRMLSSGADGNIFSYHINFPEPLKPPFYREFPVTLEVAGVPEPSTADGALMSHEQLKQKEEYDKMMAIANAHKKRVRDQLATLTGYYSKLVRANRELPVSQQIDVTLDPRPPLELEREVDEARALVRRKLAHQLEASNLRLAKMHGRNIICLDVFPFTLKAIMDPNVVIKPLRQKNLSSDFYDQLDEVHKKMAEAALRMKQTGSVVRHTTAKKVAWGAPRTASFLLGLPPMPPHPLKKALRNYYQRLTRHHEQHIEWQEHLSRKPDPNELPPGAAEALQEAEASIGNYLLKTEPNYVAPPGHNTQLRLCITRQEIYDNKHEFNVKVVALREEKQRLVRMMQDVGARLAEIRGEVPPALAKPPPHVPDIDEDLEFPEKNLEVSIEMPHSSRRPASKYDRRKSVFPQIRIRQERVPAFVDLLEKRPLVATWELLKGKDAELTPFEKEIKQRRIQRRLYEQDMLLADSEASISEFDARLKELQRERIRVQEHNQLLELHLLQLHREMIVLNRFESHEDSLAERVYSKLMQVRGVHEQIDACKRRVEEHLVERERLEAAALDMQRVFKRLVQDNKFADFLRRIFKKKYRPPRTKDTDESSESESETTSSSEEDEGSIDSRDIGPIRLDPNICPEGCEREIYDQTFQLRNTRHKLEQDMREQDRLVELLHKDIEAHNRVHRKLGLQLDKRQKNLREFMTEKQSCMNEVEVTVVLRYDQIRANALAGCEGTEGLDNTLVFPETLLSRLRRRVLELQQEINDQKIRHKTNRTHLHRMEVDVRHMQARAEELRARMRDVLARKLGRVRRVDRTLDDLLKQMARRFKYRAGEAPHVDLHEQIRSWRERYGQQEQQYLKTLEMYSERLRLAAALQADQYPVKEQRDLSRCFGSYRPDEYERDVVRMRIVRRQQRDQIKALRDEIRRLRMKPLAPLPPPLPNEGPQSPRESEFSLFEFPPTKYRKRTKYFPSESSEAKQRPLDAADCDAAAAAGSERVIPLLWRCAEALGVPQEDSMRLLSELTDLLPLIVAGTTSRYDAVDSVLRGRLRRRGDAADDAAYRDDTRAFDALNLLLDTLVDQNLSYAEGSAAVAARGSALQQAGLAALEEALQLLPRRSTIEEHLRGALEALVQSMPGEDFGNTEVVATIVTSLLQSAMESPITEQLDNIDINAIVDGFQGAGKESVRVAARSVVEALAEQAVDGGEAQQLDEEVERQLSRPSSAAPRTPAGPPLSRSAPAFGTAPALPASPVRSAASLPAAPSAPPAPSASCLSLETTPPKHSDGEGD